MCLRAPSGALFYNPNMHGTRKIVFDTETTGVDADKRAVEIAMIEIDDDLNEIGRCHSLINPLIPISPEASAVNGITNEMVATAPTIEQWVEQTFGGPLEGEVTLVGHRIEFDRPLFAPIGNCVHTLDTLVLTQVFVQDELPNRKLDTLKDHFQLEGGGESHRAMADTVTAYQLLCHLVQLSGRKFADLAAVPYWILHYAPWGRYEDKPLAEVPRAYREWLLSLPDLDINLRKSLEQIALSDKPWAKPVPGRRYNIPRRII